MAPLGRGALKIHQLGEDLNIVAKQRIFISGVAGFLGSHLADAFLADGHEVVGNDNMIGGYLDNVPEGVEFYQYDCNDFGKLKDHMKGVDIVYHCAATAYEGLSVFSPHMITQNIVGASTGDDLGGDRQQRAPLRDVLVDGPLRHQPGAVHRRHDAAAAGPLRHRQIHRPS